MVLGQRYILWNLLFLIRRPCLARSVSDIADKTVLIQTMNESLQLVGDSKRNCVLRIHIQYTVPIPLSCRDLENLSLTYAYGDGRSSVG
jgi:hypothetical protein